MGTSGVVFAALPEYRADPQARVHAFCHAVPGAWHAMGVMLSAAGSLAWLRGVVGGEFAELTAEAAEWEPGREGLTFLPYLTGERTPHADPDARGAFTGLEIRHDRGALVRAVLEGVACGLRDSLRPRAAGGAARPRRRGGGARSELWLKIVASVLEMPLERLAVEEGAAYGAALLGGVAGGLWARRARGRRGVRAHALARSSPVAEWIDAVPRAARSATARSTRLCRQSEEPAMTPPGSDPRWSATAEHRFTFGLWTVGNPGRDPFGGPTRAPLDPGRLACTSSPSSAPGASASTTTTSSRGASRAAERDRIVARFKAALDETGPGRRMATTNLFGHPAFKDGAFTSNDRGVRRAAIGKAMRSIDLGAELGAEVYVFWGGREGTEAGVAKDPRDALERYREAIDVLGDYVVDHGYDLRFALEPKPNEPRGDIFLPTVGHALHFIATLERPEMVGVNPEVAHETMAGPVVPPRASARRCGRASSSTSTSTRSGSAATTRTSASAPRTSRRRSCSCGCSSARATTGPRHFDAHAYRNEDAEGVWDFAARLHAHLPRAGRARRAHFDSLPEVQEALGGRVDARARAAPASTATRPTRSRPRPTSSTRSPSAATTTSARPAAGRRAARRALRLTSVPGLLFSWRAGRISRVLGGERGCIACRDGGRGWSCARRRTNRVSPGDGHHVARAERRHIDADGAVAAQRRSAGSRRRRSTGNNDWFTQAAPTVLNVTATDNVGVDEAAVLDGQRRHLGRHADHAGVLGHGRVADSEGNNTIRLPRARRRRATSPAASPRRRRSTRRRRPARRRSGSPARAAARSATSS